LLEGVTQMSSKASGYEFLCRVLSPHTTPSGVSRLRKRMGGGEVAWESVIAIANNHLLTAALWVRLRQKKLDRLLDPDVRHYLNGMHALNLNRNHGLRRQLLEAIEILNRNDIHPLIIKGGAQLLDPVHGDMGSRIMTDIDMWVPKGQLPIAVDALAAIGYGDGGKSLKNYHHWAPLFREGEYGAIELHSDVLPDSLTRVLNAADICRQSASQSTQGLCFRIPNPTHAILLAMLHSQVNDRLYYEWAVGLKSLNDMVAMATHYRGVVDWDEIHTRMARHGLVPVLQCFLWSAQRLFGHPLPAGMRPSLGAISHHAFCMAATRWRVADKMAIKIDRYRRNIHRRFGGFQGFLRYAFARVIPG
jgi:hypothetical protein